MRSRQRGFSLLVVMMLIALMVGGAAILMSSVQQQFQIAGQDREAAAALYAADYAIAQGKAFIASNPALYSTAGGWTPLLTSGNVVVQNVLCQSAGGLRPGTVYKSVNGPVTLYAYPVGGQTTSWTYCLHNNADDPSYIDSTKYSGTPDGDLDDSQDPLNLLVIEGYGFGPNGAAAHIAVTVSQPTLNGGGGFDSYAQDRGGASHSGSTNANETGVVVGAGGTTF